MATQSNYDPTLSQPIEAGRFLQYAVIFVGLMVSLFAFAGLSSLALSQIVPSTRDLISADDLRQQLSYMLAALIVSTPLWVVFWRLAQRRLSRDDRERTGPERRLFLAAVIGVSAVVALYALRTVLQVLFTLPAEHDTAQVLKDLVPVAIRLIVYGAACFVMLRIAAKDRGPVDVPHDLALYAVTGFSLLFLITGTVGAVSLIIGSVQEVTGTLIASPTNRSLWSSWGQVAAWTIPGAAVWGILASYDRRRNVAPLRLLFHYLVLIPAAAMTLIPGTLLLYEVLRRLAGYSQADRWGFVNDAVPTLVAGAGLWAYTWIVIREQSSEEDRRAILPELRRPGIAAYAAVGLAMLSVGCAILLWLALDAIFGTHEVLVSSSSWWRDRFSAGIVLALVGLILCAPSWFRMERAAEADPDQRTVTERRLLLSIATLAGALAGLGFTIAFLWKIIRMVLGDGAGTDTVSTICKFLGTALIAVAVAAYYGLRLRADMRIGGPSRHKALVLILLEPGGDATLAELRRSLRNRIRVNGYVPASTDGPHLPLDEIRRRIEAGETDRILLVLGPSGGMVIPYAQRPQPAPAIENGSAPLPAPGS